MQLYPSLYLENVQQITLELLQKYQIKALILDVDNTLINYEKQMPEGTKHWCDTLKKEGIQFCIVSNTNQKEKVEQVAKTLEIPYFYFAMKPLKRGFKKAIQTFQLKEEQIAAVGDQIFTDIWGANRSHVFSILVKPIEKQDIWVTKLKRPLENWVIQKYEKQIKK